MGTIRDINEWINHWFWKWASPSVRALLGDHGKGAPLPATLRGRWNFLLSGDLVCWGLENICKRKLWKHASLSTGAPSRNLEGARFTRELRDRWRALEMEHPFLCELCKGNLEGGLFYWQTWRISNRKVLEIGISIGALFGNMEGNSFTMDFEWR